MTGNPTSSPANPARRAFLGRSLRVLAAPLLLTGGPCSMEPEPERPPTLTARPGPPTETPDPGLHALNLGSNRDGFLFVPDGYTPEAPAPLVVILHGAGGTARTAWTAYTPFAEARGIVVLAVDSRGRTWDLIQQGAYGPDIDFLDRALYHTFARCRVDPARLALAGFSDGGSYTLSVGPSNGDLFTHLIAYAPGFVVPSSPLVGMPRLFVAHGTGDSIIPVAASRDRIVPNFRGAGYDVTYREYDADHLVNAQMADDTLDWLVPTERSERRDLLHPGPPVPGLNRLATERLFNTPWRSGDR